MWLPSTTVVSVTVYSPTSSFGTVIVPSGETVPVISLPLPVILYVTLVAFWLATGIVISSPYTFSTSSALTLEGAGVTVIFDEFVATL